MYPEVSRGIRRLFGALSPPSFPLLVVLGGYLSGLCSSLSRPLWGIT